MGLLAFVLALAAAPASAASIRFVTFDFPGLDIWSYTYSFHPGAEPFQEGMGFAIEFDPNLYASLDTFQVGGFDVLLLQPDLELPAPGVFDVLSLDFYEEELNFTVFFLWLGGADTPGSQPYSLYTLDELGQVTITGSGVTVPEPAAAAMLLLALGLLGARARAWTW